MITILYGTETGNSEYLSDILHQALDEMGFDNRVFDLGDYDESELDQEKTIILITSTYGNGEPPANAQDFFEYLENLANEQSEPILSHLKYAVCGLGDRTFQNFANAGKLFDALFEKLGAHRMIQRIDCDDDYEDQFEVFQSLLLDYLNTK